MAAFVTVSAHAGVVSGTTMPEALQGINPVSSVCLRSDVAAAPAHPGGTASLSRVEASCAATPAQVAALRADASTVLVDVRAKPGGLPEGVTTLPMPLSAVRTKLFLREKTVVLIGDGKMERELYEACSTLRGQGFVRVRVLHGGVPNWPEVHGGGVPPGLELTPVELWAESQFDANLVLFSGRQAELRAQMPSGVDLPALTPEAVKAAIKRWRQDHKAPFLSSLVLVLGTGADPADVQRMRAAVQPVPVLVYSGSEATYLQQLSQQKTLWAAQARGPRKPACGL